MKPRIGEIGIYDMKRSQVTAMLNEIADNNGPVAADRALGFTRKAFNWFELDREITRIRKAEGREPIANCVFA